MSLILHEELLPGHITFGLLLFMLLHLFFSEICLIRDIICSTIRQLGLRIEPHEVGPSYLERDTILNLKSVKGIVNQLSDLLLGDFAHLLADFFAESVSFLLLPHPLFVLSNVELLSIFLLLLCDGNSLVELFMTMRYEI
jgi:hypothetical protein